MGETAWLIFAVESSGLLGKASGERGMTMDDDDDGNDDSCRGCWQPPGEPGD